MSMNHKNKVLLGLAVVFAVMVPCAMAFHPVHTGKMAVDMTKVTATSTSDPRTILHYRDNADDASGLLKRVYSPPKQQKPTQELQRKTGVQIDLVRTLAESQFVALAGVSILAVALLALTGHSIDLNNIHWNDSDHFRSLFSFSNINLLRTVEGVVAAVPLIYIGSQIETSDKREVSQVNFSTTNMVMTLFGRRHHKNSKTAQGAMDHATLRPETPMIHALLISTAIALLTGISEEIIFRGMIPTAVFHVTQSVIVALLGQAVLFGVGHQNPSMSHGENRVIGELQTTSGFWYGMVYLMSGGDILPCIIAHSLYDLHIFMETWMHINDQMDYTDTEVLKRLTKEDEDEIRKIKQESGPSLSVETLAFLRRFFYAFDNDRVGALSKSDVQRAVSYVLQQDTGVPSEERVAVLFDRMISTRSERITGNLQDRLQLPEFVRMMLVLRTNPIQPVA